MAQREFSFITSLENLRIDRPLGSNWTIAGDLKISNSQSVASRLLTELLKELIGKLEVNQILSGRPFVYSVSEYPVEETSEEMQKELLVAHLVHVQAFTNALWLVKDNSVNFNLGFLQFPYQGQQARVSSNFLSATFSDASTINAETSFDEAELKQAISLYNKMYGQSHDEFNIPQLPPLALGQYDRASRSMYFVQAARAATHLPEKVAYFCTCFESLVSTSPTEIGHQVAERVASLIAETPSEALEIYRNLKRAYDTRSKLVHGGQLGRTECRYRTDSKNCDAYLRRLFHVLLGNSEIREAIEQEENEVNEFFLRRLLGGLS